MEPLPHAGLITSAQCGHCTKLRGVDGIPKNSNDHFTPPFIRNILKVGNDKRTVNFIELHVERLSNESQIAEINIYDSIASSQEIQNLRKRNNLEIQNLQLGTGHSVVRISIKRGMEIVAHIEDGGTYIESPTLSDFFTNHYIWNTCPQEISRLRNSVRTGSEYSHDLDPKIISQIDYQHFCDDPRALDRYLIERVFDFNILYRELVPRQIRNYEDMYPSWFLVSQNQWNKALQNKDYNMFAKIAGKLTEFNESTGEYTLRDSGKKNLLTELELYKQGNVKLEPKTRKGRIFA